MCKLNTFFSSNTLPVFLFVLLGIFLGSCSKQKYDFTYDNQPETFRKSPVRLINFALYQQVYHEGMPLTNSFSDGKPTPYFVENGLLGRTWDVPAFLFDANGETEIKLSEIYRVTPSIPTSQYTLTLNMKSQDGAVDYYTLWPQGSGQAPAVAIPRATERPSQPDHIKIRLVNLSKAMRAVPAEGSSGPLENVHGPISLTYADGTPVDPQTSDLSPEDQYSAYIEIPYGTYQFKVLTQDGRQIAASVHGRNEDTYLSRLMDPASSRMLIPDGTGRVTQLTYAPLQTYQPGGVYSIVVAPFPFEYRPSTYFEGAYQNQFKIIEDMPAPANTSFAKVQGVHAFPGEQVHFQINGKKVGSLLDFGTASPYQIVKAGDNYSIKAMNAQGKELASLEYPIQAGQNHSVWLWKDASGNPQLISVSNDLSTEFFVPRFEDNGSRNRYENTMTLSTRFLNLSPDVPYLSFTINDGQDMDDYMQLYDPAKGHIQAHSEDALYNLEPGEVVESFPYLRWRVDHGFAFKWLAYRSKPGVIPGVWADDIPAFTSNQLVTNTDLYTPFGRNVPASEPGIYTLALIGSTQADAPVGQEARIVAIKHNQ